MELLLERWLLLLLEEEAVLALLPVDGRAEELLPPRCEEELLLDVVPLLEVEEELLE